MAGLTRTNVIDRAKALLSFDSDRFITSAQQILLADDANRHVYSLLVEANPEHFRRTSNITWPANTEAVDITGVSYLNLVPERLLQIEDYPSSGGLTASNRPRQWREMKFHERVDRHAAGWRGTYYYCWLGDHLYVAPLPTTALNVTVYFVAQAAALSDSTTEVLGGFAEQFGDAVAYYLAQLMNAKQEGNNPVIDGLWSRAEARIKNSAYRRTNNGPRRVSYGPR